ncbi:MAG: amidohydrolase [Peptostreptococcaceae bacterium]|nr:amidohydrolase [Peptostreptococcaceae bacterium]
MNFEKIKLEDITESDAKEIVELRRYFHQHPEPSLKEYNTSKKIKSLLDEWGIEYQSVGETSVLGIIHGNRVGNKTILLRADMDALEMKDRKDVPYRSTKEGLHHACGHDGHTAALLVAAKILKQKQNEFGGTVKFAFQQAEEIGAGARQFVDSGHLGDVDMVFGIHLNSEYPTGSIVLASGARYASCDIFKIHVQGESAYAAKPHLAKDALLSAGHIVVALQSIVSRNIDPLEPAVISIGVLHAGTRYNVIANDAYIEGTIRALSRESRQKMLSLVEEIARHTARVQNTDIEFSNYPAANVLINDEKATIFAQQVAKQIVGEVIEHAPATLGAEDFADFLERVPGTFAYVGTRNLQDSSTHYPHHHELFDIDERGLHVAAQLHIKIALDFLASE